MYWTDKIQQSCRFTWESKKLLIIVVTMLICVIAEWHALSVVLLWNQQLNFVWMKSPQISHHCDFVLFLWLIISRTFKCSFCRELLGTGFQLNLKSLGDNNSLILGQFLYFCRHGKAIARVHLGHINECQYMQIYILGRLLLLSKHEIDTECSTNNLRWISM